VTLLNIGMPISGNYLNGWIKTLTYWPERKADAALVTLST